MSISSAVTITVVVQTNALKYNGVVRSVAYDMRGLHSTSGEVCFRNFIQEKLEDVFDTDTMQGASMD